VAGLQQQEQSDVQTLLSGLGQSNAQEQADVAGLSTGITGVQAQESSDIQQMLANIAAASQQAAASAVQAVQPSVSTLTNQVASVAAGQQAVNRSNQTLALLLQRGDIGWLAAPFGATKPNAPGGYTSVGLGNGYWAFKPNTPVPSGPARSQGTTKRKGP
jgi:hypothetical protein